MSFVSLRGPRALSIQIRDIRRTYASSWGVLYTVPLPVSGWRESTSAGSFFTNPIVDLATAERIGAPRFPAPDGKVKLPAAWLIERAGFSKGHAMGRTHISKKHALALVTTAGATVELLDLARAIRRGVHERSA